MADVIKKATNKFTKGLVLDFSPENTRNEVLTHALNATLLTFNGNELSLLNDMGNARVETAFLPEGYIPVGTCEYGGIIYIVSYNPLEDKSQIGCFPSPERNVSSDELGKSDVVITKADFQKLDSNNEPTGKIINNSKYVLLKDDNLNPGDKFAICSTLAIYQEALSDLYINDGNGYQPKENPLLKLSVVSIDDSGKITYLDSTLKLYELNTENRLYKYHILGEASNSSNTQKVDIDSYRNTLSSGYSVFKSKTSGKLAILAELIMIDSYSVTHSLRPRLGSNNMFDIIIHTEVSPEITQSNINTAPKLKYYYLKDSQGELTTYNSTTESVNIINLFDDNGETTTFVNTELNTIFETNHLDDSNKNLFNQTIEDAGGVFNFKNKNSYYKHSTEEFLVSDTSNYSYEDITIGSITIPPIIFDNNLEFPFKYNYTLVPCMEYGKLEHLAVSNTIDFSKLRSFEKSDFTTWKYRIDGDQLRLTLGAEIYDTFINDKVDGLFLEFYDLWGFAGSLEITGKDSYNGVFTKLISLNTLQALNKNRIINNEFKSGYKRNVNITPADNQFKYKDTIVTWNNETGWEGIKEEDNDCGVLYSNLIYGVKTYIRQTTSTGLIFTPKSLFFLYTLPILNDYYYNTDNFNTINNPKLQFALSHRIEDLSNISTYTNTLKHIKEGYTEEDLEVINLYKQATYENVSLNSKIYYLYRGCSKLQLEVGLKQEYTNYNLSFDKNLNKLFSCKLALVSNEDNLVFDVTSDVDASPEILLSYTETNLKVDDNTLGFGSDKSPEIPISSDQFLDLQFITSSGLSSIDINYNFIIGFSYNINNIRKESIAANVICALLHKKDDNLYNFDDFGIHNIGTDTNPNYTTQAMFANHGNADVAYCSILKHIKDRGTIDEQCVNTKCCYIGVIEGNSSNSIISGNPLKSLNKEIGKLTFCQPHAHAGIGEYDNGVNIKSEGSYHVIPTHPGRWKVTNKLYDDFLGAAPYTDYRLSPWYNLCFNTVNSVEHNNNFRTTLDYVLTTCSVKGCDINYNPNAEDKIKTVGGLKFTGLTGDLLIKFYNCLVNTMKNVYAYNKDYDKVSILTGDLTIAPKLIKFSSNLINKSSAFNFGEKCLNDYIYLGYVTITLYLNNLHTYSNELISIKNSLGVLLSNIQFDVDYTYCGTDLLPLLIRLITYSTTLPKTINNFIVSNTLPTLIKHSDGSFQLIDGKFKRNSLYGFNAEYQKLISLDVTNYTIDDEGNLHTILNDILKNSTESIIEVDRTIKYSGWNGYKYSVNKEYKNACIRGTSLTINDLEYNYESDHRLYTRDDNFKLQVNDGAAFSRELENELGPPYRPILLYRSVVYEALHTCNNSGYHEAKNYSKYNRIYLYSGPCFTYDNLL